MSSKTSCGRPSQPDGRMLETQWDVGGTAAVRDTPTLPRDLTKPFEWQFTDPSAHSSRELEGYSFSASALVISAAQFDVLSDGIEERVEGNLLDA